MTDTEFQVLDELYFVSSFQDLLANCSCTETELEELLISLLKKDWVKALQPDRETEASELEAGKPTDLPKYFYLATKAGLLAHNSR